MNFVIGFLGLFIYLIVASWGKESAKQTSLKNDREFLSKQKLYNNWINEITDIDIEHQVVDCVSDYRNQESIYSIIYPIIESFPNFEIKYEDCSRFMYNITNDYPRLTERILMALKGKLLMDDANYGITSPPVYDSCVRHKWDVFHDFIIWLDSQLKNSGHLYSTFFIEGSLVDKLKNDMSIRKDIHNINCKVRGKYFWIPMVFWLDSN